MEKWAELGSKTWPGHVPRVGAEWAYGAHCSLSGTDSWLSVCKYGSSGVVGAVVLAAGWLSACPQV